MIDWKLASEYRPEPYIYYFIYLPIWGFYKDVVLVAMYHPEDDEWRVNESWRIFDAQYVTHFADITYPLRVKNES